MATQPSVQPGEEKRTTATPPPTSAPPVKTATPRAVKRTTPGAVKKTPRSRAGAAWVGICVAAIVLIALIIFMLQNTQPVLVTFLSMQGTVPLAIALLIAGIGVGIVALTIGTIRIGQLRRRLSYERRG